jgi:hypothetical protein
MIRAPVALRDNIALGDPIHPIKAPDHPNSRFGSRFRIVRSCPARNTPAMNFTKNIGMLLLAIYLILVGLVTLLGLGIGYIAGIIALLAGVFILIGK